VEIVRWDKLVGMHSYGDKRIKSDFTILSLQQRLRASARLGQIVFRYHERAMRTFLVLNSKSRVPTIV
jgi:hypothetical protein